MMLHPAVMALLIGSLLVVAMLLRAGWFGWQVLRRWDLTSGSEEQLLLERQTYLVSTLLSWVFAIQLCSLFYFVAIAESLCPLVTGAMCAAGILNANPYGYPALLLKMVGFLAAGSWLIFNHADNQGYDYPLLRRKFGLLLAIVPLVLAETATVWLFFARLKVNVITSCCGSLFGEQGGRVTATLASLPFRPAMVVFWGLLCLTMAAGCRFLWCRRGAAPFGLLALLTLPVGLGAVIAGIAPYFYELPTHHCPFCILKGEYHRVGYLLLGPLLVSGAAGSGVCLLHPFRTLTSLAAVIPRLQRRLAVAILASLVLLAVVVLWRMTMTPFRM